MATFRRRGTPPICSLAGIETFVTAYDAVYIALAEALAAARLTRNRKLVSATG